MRTKKVLRYYCDYCGMGHRKEYYENKNSFTPFITGLVIGFVISYELPVIVSYVTEYLSK